MSEVGLPVRAALHPTGLYLALRQIGAGGAAGRLHAGDDRAYSRLREPSFMSPGTSSAERRRDTAPAGIIFHVARCGSTLISQSLKQLDNLVVYAEPQPVNEILAPPHRWPRAELVAALRTLGARLRPPRARAVRAEAEQLEHAASATSSTEAFPETHWVLSLRDPVEVGVSLLRQPPGWLQRHGGGVARPRRDRRSGGSPGVTAKSSSRAHTARSATAAARLDAGRGTARSL